jgi:uncharacterized membrane protein
MRFNFTDLIPHLEKSGWVGIGLGFLISWILLVFIHARTKEERSRRKSLHHTDPVSRSSSGHQYGALETELNDFTSARVDEEAKPKTPRYCFIDCARGLAICFVTFFHYVWNLRHNDVLSWQPKDDEPHELFLQIVEFWIFFGISFVILSEVFHVSVFLGYLGFALVTAICIMWHYWAAQLSGVGIIMFCAGISSYVQNRGSIRWDKIFSRIKKLFIVSLCITLVTYVFLPDGFVYFGAIHCITLVSILHLPFLKYPQFAIVGTIAIFSYKAFIGEFPLEVRVFRSTVDHMPWFENLGYLLFGIFGGHMGVHRATHYIRCLWGKFNPGLHLEDSVFPFLGRHSLFIFISHQVVLFPLVKLVTGHPLF